MTCPRDPRLPRDDRLTIGSSQTSKPRPTLRFPASSREHGGPSGARSLRAVGLRHQRNRNRRLPALCGGGEAVFSGRGSLHLGKREIRSRRSRRRRIWDKGDRRRGLSDVDGSVWVGARAKRANMGYLSRLPTRTRRRQHHDLRSTREHVRSMVPNRPSASDVLPAAVDRAQHVITDFTRCR